MYCFLLRLSSDLGGVWCFLRCPRSDLGGACAEDRDSGLKRPIVIRDHPVLNIYYYCLTG